MALLEAGASWKVLRSLWVCPWRGLGERAWSFPLCFLAHDVNGFLPPWCATPNNEATWSWTRTFRSISQKSALYKLISCLRYFVIVTEKDQQCLFSVGYSSLNFLSFIYSFMHWFTFIYLSLNVYYLQGHGQIGFWNLCSHVPWTHSIRGSN